MSQLEKDRLDNLADGVTVAHVGPTSAFFTDRGIPFFRTGNVGDRKLILENLKQITPEFHQKLRKSTLKGGDIMVSRVVSDRITCAIVPPEFNGANCGNVIVIRPGKNIVSEYLAHLITMPESQRQLLQRQVGSAQAVVNTSVLKAWEIPLPPIAQQKRIAAILDKAEELRGLRWQALGALDAIVQSIFLEMFGDPVTNPKGWKTHLLDDLIVDGLQNGLYKPSSDYGEGTPILRIDAFYSGRVTKLDSLKRVRISEAEQETYGLQEDDIVINRVNSIEYLGKSALIPKLHEPTVFESNMMRFRLKQKNACPRFIVEFLQTPFIKVQIRTGTKDAVNQSSINQQDVRGFQIRVPPLSLQQEFARRVEAIEQLKTTHRQSLTQLDALFASLQHRAFRGDL